MITTLVKSVAALAALSALAGCFGGGGDDSVVVAPPADPLVSVPDSATISTDGTVAYLEVLSQNATDTKEPVDVSGVTLPTSETAEPKALN